MKMTNLKDVHLRLDVESKAQWIEVVELMGETMQSQAFRKILQEKLNELQSRNSTSNKDLNTNKTDGNGKQ